MMQPDYELGNIKQCKVRNMNMIEEMAEIEYVFCDKTGTLTQNELLFKAITVSPTAKEDQAPQTVIGIGNPD